MPPRKRVAAKATPSADENVPEHEVKKSKLAKALEEAETKAVEKVEKELNEIAPDPEFPHPGCHVYVDPEGTVYDAMLNQVFIPFKN